MRHIPFRGILLASMAVAAAAVSGDLATARRELASTSRLRVGVVSAPKANVFFVATTSAGSGSNSGRPLGNELARTLDVASDFLVVHNSGEITDALEKGLIDVAFLPVVKDADGRPRGVTVDLKSTQLPAIFASRQTNGA